MTDGFICEMKNLLQAIQNWNLKAIRRIVYYDPVTLI